MLQDSCLNRVIYLKCIIVWLLHYVIVFYVGVKELNNIFYFYSYHITAVLLSLYIQIFRIDEAPERNVPVKV